MRAAPLACLLAILACSRSDPPLFRLLPPERTGITFANTIQTNDSLNVQTEVYVYNGAGVAIGDIDGDGLADVYLTGNMVSSRLYLNRGGMRFQDITDSAGVGTTVWAAGAAMADVNADGMLDIYVSVSGHSWSTGADRANRLFLNQGNRRFVEAAAQYGIADTGFTTHAAFLDYDRDGCLDLFVLNNSPEDFSRGGVASHPTRPGATPGSLNRLYRNSCRGTFSDVSDQAGILRTAGYGLGVAVGDLNRDGWPDIYVSNDANPNDVLYVNDRDGTFTDRAGQWLRHASFAGMGVDIADIDNDGWQDILQVDMMPADPDARKRISGFMTYGGAQASHARGFRDDYSVNTLQLSSGLLDDSAMAFSEIARMAGVAYTDWSWSALLADFDNDGLRDAFISNGYPKAVNDFDYQVAMFATRRASDSIAGRRQGLEILSRLGPWRLPNHVFRNTGDLTFADRTAPWGMRQPSISYGAAYGDLNNDGRLDLVVNNMDAPAFVYENVGAGSGDAAPHFLAIRFDGPPAQFGGIGASVTLTAGGRRQYAYHTPFRGYMSSMDPRLHFGLGNATRIDTLDVVWPDGRRQRLTDVAADQLLTIRHADAAADPLSAERHADAASASKQARAAELPFSPYPPALAPAALHRVGTLVDYGAQPLLPYMLSRHGPALAVSDVDRDGLDDLYVGGGGGVPAQLFLQTEGGAFVPAPTTEPWRADRVHEDWGATFFDANGDSLPDLYVTSGSYHLPAESRLLQDRLYINRGGGAFSRDAPALPAMLTSTGVVRAGDFTGDGRPDLFVGGRLSPRSYPFPVRSYLLRNDGGRFTDVTAQVAPALAEPAGMVTDAAWLDFDGDGRLDLVTVGEWMPIQFLRNEGARFRDVTRATGLPPLRGWWFSLGSGDFDADGRPDLVAGNLGLNYSYTTSSDSAFGVVAGDFFGVRTTHVVLTQDRGGRTYPVAGRVPLAREVYQWGLRFPTYSAFASATIEDLLTPAQRAAALRLQVDTFASVFLHNRGGGRFSLSALPPLAQIAPIRGVLPHDVDGDGHLDIVVAGNLYSAEPNTPRADAGNGLWLRGDGKGRFAPVPPWQSGLLLPGDVAGLATIRTRRGHVLIAANTGDSLQTFSITKSGVLGQKRRTRPKTAYSAGGREVDIRPP